MATPISHIIYAKKYFEKHPSTINKDEFILGCAFPDIRRIDENIKRKDTHLHFDTLDLNFEGLTAFQAGWKFHLYCDMRREEILKNHGFYSLPNTEDFGRLAGKHLDDELVYENYNNWEKLVHYFNNPSIVEALPGVSRETFSLWYAITAKYIEKKPDSRATHGFLVKQPSLVKKADGIIQSIDKLRKDEKVVELLKKVAEEIV